MYADTKQFRARILYTWIVVTRVHLPISDMMWSEENDTLSDDSENGVDGRPPGSEGGGDGCVSQLNDSGVRLLFLQLGKSSGLIGWSDIYIQYMWCDVGPTVLSLAEVPFAFLDPVFFPVAVVDKEEESLTPSIFLSKSGSLTMDTPTCAAFRAPTSLVPSPHMRVWHPDSLRASSTASFWDGDTLAKRQRCGQRVFNTLPKYRSVDADNAYKPMNEVIVQ